MELPEVYLGGYIHWETVDFVGIRWKTNILEKFRYHICAKQSQRSLAPMEMCIRDGLITQK